jgi:hypothetical protein
MPSLRTPTEVEGRDWVGLIKLTLLRSQFNWANQGTQSRIQLNF